MHDGIINDRLENIVAVSSVNMSERAALVGNVHLYTIELKVVICVFLALAEVLDDKCVVCAFDRDSHIGVTRAVYKDIRGIEPLKAQCVQTVYVNYCVASVAFCENVCVVARAAFENIVANSAVKKVIAVITVDSVVAFTAINRIITIAAEKEIVPVAAVDSVVSAVSICR